MSDDVLSPVAFGSVNGGDTPPKQTDQWTTATERPDDGGETLVVDEVVGSGPSEILPGETESEEAMHASLAQDTGQGEAIVEASAESLAAGRPDEAEFAAADFEGALEEGASFEALFGEADAPEMGGLSVPEFLPDAGAATGEAEPEFLGAVLGKVLPVVASAGKPLLSAIFKRTRPTTRRKIRASRRSRDPLRAQLAKLLARLETVGELDEVGEASAETLDDADRVIAEEVGGYIEAIIGRDTRVRVRGTTRLPWRRYCALRITMPSGATFRGTGFLIGPRAVATAGHCVYLHDQGGWAQSIEVIPGADGSAKPFGSVNSVSLRSVSGWVKERQPTFDYGCVILPRGAFSGKGIGQFGFASFANGVLLSRNAVVAGYPGDKPFAELWGDSKRIKAASARRLIYTTDTFGGQSGAPVYVKRNGTRYVVGIHNYGSSRANFATRITPAVFHNLKTWGATT